MDVLLKTFPYKYMAYEKELMYRELHTFFRDPCFIDMKGDVLVKNVDEEQIPLLDRLTYFMTYEFKDQHRRTLQAKLEDCNANDYTSKRQHTRYSTNGIHEYKGKFNPQIVHSIVNILGISSDMNIIDPFCGSGTTILECQHMGISSVGVDINPFAVFVSNVKTDSLLMDVNYVNKVLLELCELSNKANSITNDKYDARIEYLLKWIPVDTLTQMESIKNALDHEPPMVSNFLLVMISDLIRDYSYQEPSDLRIRRRFSSFPEMNFIDALKAKALKQLQLISTLQESSGYIKKTSIAINCDIRRGNTQLDKYQFDAAITSPPYATALPYIDTQRLSLVWLGFCPPSEITKLESTLIGSRDIYNGDKKHWLDAMSFNSNDLPNEIMDMLYDMQESLSSSDGFRKQAMPTLLYRYFSDMKAMFMRMADLVKENGYYAMVVGHNKTTLGGKTFDIDTPRLLGIISSNVGWSAEEELPLQTYKRYGLNSKNSINCETLLLLRNRRGIE